MSISEFMIVLGTPVMIAAGVVTILAYVSTQVKKRQESLLEKIRTEFSTKMGAIESRVEGVKKRVGTVNKQVGANPSRR